MQIYTKIFIGMAVGVLVGFLFGPRSPLLTPDLLVVREPHKLVLLEGPGGQAQGPRLPKLDPPRKGRVPPLLVRVLERRHSGRGLYYRVEFRVTDRLALKAGDRALEAGKLLSGWVDASEVPTAVSSIGHSVVSVLAPVGTAFLRLIKMVIVPLVFASLLVGVASLGDPRRLGRLGGKALGYFLVTTMIAISIGITAANLIQPGRYLSAEHRAQLEGEYAATAAARSGEIAVRPTFVDNLLEIIPDNPLASLSNGAMLQVIFFAVILGIALTLVDQRKASKLIVAFEAINDAMVKIVEMVMKLAPYGVLALVAKTVGESGLEVLGALLVYSVVVVAGLLLHALAVYTSVVRVVGGIRVSDFWRAVRPAQLVAFSTSSSSVTLPVTMECAERNLGVSKRVSAFVLPLGATVNMDGSALYQGVAAVFIAQVFNVDLTLADQLMIVLTATLASIGTASVPGAAMVTLALVLTSSGVPTVGLALILGVDRILDMFRTLINVTGDVSAAVLVAATEGEDVSYRGQNVGSDDPDDES